MNRGELRGGGGGGGGLVEAPLSGMGSPAVLRIKISDPPPENEYIKNWSNIYLNGQRMDLESNETAFLSYF